MTPRLKAAITKAIGALPAVARPIIGPLIRELVAAVLEAAKDKE